MKSIRQQILRALNVGGGESTVEELLDQIDGFTRKQVSDNMQAIVQDKLATRRKDASTGMPAYVITDLGVARIKVVEPASVAWNDALAKKMPPSGITIDTGELANDSLRMSLAARDAEIERLNVKIKEYAGVIDGYIAKVDRLPSIPEPIEFEHYITANAMEFEQLDSAINYVINSGAANTVYGCVRLGQTEQITRWVPLSA